MSDTELCACGKPKGDISVGCRLHDQRAEEYFMSKISKASDKSWPFFETNDLLAVAKQADDALVSATEEYVGRAKTENPWCRPSPGQAGHKKGTRTHDCPACRVFVGKEADPYCPQSGVDSLFLHEKGTRTDVCSTCREHNEARAAAGLFGFGDVGRPKTEPEDQPMPVVNDLPFVHDQVAQDIAARGELGKRRYGTKLQPFNGRNALQDAYEEMLDAAVYLKQRMIEEAAAVAEIERLAEEGE